MKTSTYWLQCGIPFRLLDATFESYETPTDAHKKAVLQMKHFCEGKALFALLSKASGVGKSHLAAAALRTFGCGVFITPRQLTNLYNSLPFDGDDVTKSSLIDTLSAHRSWYWTRSKRPLDPQANWRTSTR